MSRSTSPAPVLPPWRRTLLQEEARRLGLTAPEAAGALALLAGAAREPGRPPGPAPAPRALPWGHTTLSLGTRTLIMGVINMTDDSFSGDGLGRDREAALARAEALVAAGADLLDVGGESTRPGARPVPAAEERARVVPTVEYLASRLKVPLSVDTRKAVVAEAALAAGAGAVNDVSGLRYDPALARVVARAGATLILGHWRAGLTWTRPVAAVVRGLRASVARALAAGCAPDRLAIDPGLGFAKPAWVSLALLRELHRLRVLGLPLVVGPSRKGFIGRVLGPEEQFSWEGTAAAVALAIAGGADIVRVHDVARLARVVRMADAIVRPSAGA